MGRARGSADGRVLRGQRNREAVVDAFLSLLDDGEQRPTARQIAARAGVSVRSVYQHFDDLEQIYAIAGRRQLLRLGPAFDPVDTAMPLAERLAAFVDRRRRTLESLDPIARSARLREPFSDQLQANRAHVVALMREQCRQTFAPELAAGAGGDPARAAELMVAVAAASSWAAWYHLRNDQGLDDEAAMGVMARTMGALLRFALLEPDVSSLSETSR